MKKELENLTILLNSCDKYEDLWEPFFKLFKKYGNELTSCPIVLNTETKKFAYEGLNIICPNNCVSQIEWGRRLRNTLREVKTDYVLFLLDDFFLQQPADTEIICDCISWLNKNNNVGAFNFIPIEPAKQESEKYKNFCYMPANMSYRFNAQACLWKKEVLYNSIKDEESPWDWEIYGNLRNSYIFKDCELYAIKYGTKLPYDYNFIIYEKSNPDKIVVHSAIMRGKWDLSSIEQCFKQNDINIDYSIRGLYQEPISTNNKKTILGSIKTCIAKMLRPIKGAIFKNTPYYLLVQKPIKEFKKQQKQKKN